MSAKVPPSLIIVDTPSKAEKINAFFGRKVKAIATYGAISDLPRGVGVLGIDRASMLAQYELIDDAARKMDGARAIAKIGKFLADNPGARVFLGTDPDPDGESIAAFVVKYLGLRGARRMRFNALTADAVEQAMMKAGPIDWHTVASREARRLIDRVVAHVTAPLVSQFVSQRGGGAGRLQSAVEALLVERERKVRGYRPAPFFTVHLDLGGWEARWLPARPLEPSAGPRPNMSFDADESPVHCFDQLAAHAATQHRALMVESVEEGLEEVLPPSPFTAFSMVRAANRVLGWDAEKTMLNAQRLFDGVESEHGHITYHRTSSPNVDEAAAEAARSLLRARGFPVAPLPNRWKPGAAAAAPDSEGIRPVFIDVEAAGSNDDERALYRLIRDRALFSQLAPAVSSVRRVHLVAARGDDRFTAMGRTVVEPGWLGANVASRPALREDASSWAEDGDQSLRLRLPALTKGSIVNIRHAEVRQHETNRPQRYTMRTLTKKLETIGVGRPDTLVSMLKATQARGTIRTRSDRSLEATPMAERWYDVIYPSCSLAHVAYAAELERALDAVAAGQLDGPALVRHVWDRLEREWSKLGTGSAQ